MNRTFAFTVLVMVWSLTLKAHAVTIIVPYDAETIQEAIDNAADGDLILVLPGEYQENINFSGKKVVVIAPAGPAFTLIDGGGAGPCVSFTNGEDLTAMLINFKLTGGATDDDEYGGAIRIEGAMPVIMFNEITGNRAGRGGGAIAVSQLSAPVIYRNVLYDNETAGQGGAIYISASAPQIINNTLVGNSSESDGGAIYASIGFGAQVVNNIVVGNASGDGAAITAGLFTRVTARYNDVWDNEGGNYQNVQAGDGALSQDPLFFNADEDIYLITQDSPCIDAGDPDLPGDIDESIADIGRWPFLHLPALEPVTVEPAELDFGSVPMGTDSTATLIICNPNALPVTGVLLLTPWTLFDAADSLIELDGNGEAEVAITFHPAEEREYEDTLRILSAAEMVLFDTLSISYPIGMTSVALTGTGVFNGVTGTPETPVSPQLVRVYPNPFNSRVVLKVNAPIIGNLRGEVMTLTGRKVTDLAFAGEARMTSWTPGNLPGGAYIIHVHGSRLNYSSVVQYLR
jgi:hypothetical protein